MGKNMMITRALCFTGLAAALLSFDISAAEAGGMINGKATFTGDAPARRTVKMSADPSCDAANPEGRQGEVMVINGDAIQNVFVYIKGGLGDAKHEAPSTPAMINQEGCMYTPHVLGVMVGQTIEIKNSDPTLHNVHSLPKNSPQFNNAMPIKDQVIKKKFTAEEVMVRVKCDVHPWMSAYVGVLSHPYFAVTGEDGMFSIADVPAGTYEIEAWHERLGTKTGSATVAADGTATVNFSFDPPSAG